MRAILRRSIATFVFCGVSIAIALGAPPKLTTVRGRIIAYRTFDRFAQAPSFIPNREVFLVATDKRNQTTGSTILKINYVHFELTDITEDILQGTRSLKLKVRRDSTCDESYAHFVSTAPKIQVLDGLSDVGKLDDASPRGRSIEPIRFAVGINGASFSPNLKLECYDLAKGDFKIASE